MNNDGALVDGTIAEKTALCVKNVKTVLAASGSSIDKVVKTTVFLSDMSYFAVCTPLLTSTIYPVAGRRGYMAWDLTELVVLGDERRVREALLPQARQELCCCQDAAQER